MADTPVKPREFAVNAPADTAAALSTLAARLDDAIGVERALEQRDTPRLRTTHEASYEALHSALADLSGADALDGVTRFGADIARQVMLFMLQQDAREQAHLLDHTLRHLAFAIDCETAGFGEPGITHSLRRVRDGLETLAAYHLLPAIEPSPEAAQAI